MRGTEQKDLFLNEAEAFAPTDESSPAQAGGEEATPVAGHQREKRGRKPLDPALPREMVRRELPEDERVCAHAGHALVEIGPEVHEQMDVIPEQVRVLQHYRIKYACPCCDQSLKVAPTPARIIAQGLLTEAVQAWVITGKYEFGMPLYRQAALLRRFGGDLASNTLAAASYALVKPFSPSSICCAIICWTLTWSMVARPLSRCSRSPEERRRQELHGGADQWSRRGPASAAVRVCPWARRCSRRAAVCRHPPGCGPGQQWLRGLQRHCHVILPDAPWLLEPCTASVRQGGGRDTEGSTLSQPDRDPVHQACGQPLQGRRAGH